MSDRVCAGGCGKAIPAANKSGFAWGHRNGCQSMATPANHAATSTELAVSEEIEIDHPVVDITVNERQLDRIWQTLSLRGKGTAIATVLVTHE